RKLPLPLRAVLHARRPLERGAGNHHLFRRARLVDRGGDDAGRMEAAPRQGPRLLFLAGPRRGRVRGAADGHHPASRHELGRARRDGMSMPGETRSSPVGTLTIAGLDKPVGRVALGFEDFDTLRAAAPLLDAFFEKGGNAFDTAWVYRS